MELFRKRGMKIGGEGRGGGRASGIKSLAGFNLLSQRNRGGEASVARLDQEREGRRSECCPDPLPLLEEDARAFLYEPAPRRVGS